MCDPVSIASFSLAAAGTVAQHQQAKGQAKIQTKMAEMNAVNAREAAVRSYSDMQIRQGQEISAAGDAIRNRRMQEMREQSTARAAAADSGVSGFSVDALINEISGVSSKDVSTITQNRDWSVDQMSRQMEGIQSQAEGRANSIAPGIKPNPWATAFKIGAAGLNSYTGTLGKS